ncbi:MAG: UDP-N-acetylmuramate--L-alanine ligase [Bacteroidota bacterium]
MPEHINNVYFIGAGGIGMSALARYFVQQGKFVAGYDRTPSRLTLQLEEEGVILHYEDNAGQIPQKIREDKNSLIVFTPAIPDTNNEKQYFLTSGHKLMKRAEVLGWLSRLHPTIAVAGTHGKTTVSTMLAHLLQYGNNKAHAFLGGISLNYNTNYISGDENGPMVVEADEFDRSFLQLSPQASIITMVDADHLDIYNDKNGLETAFNTFASNTKNILLHRHDAGLLTENKIKYTYDLINENADFYVDRYRQEGLYYHFNLKTPDGLIQNLSMGVPGMLNLENMVAALAMAYLNGMSESNLREAVKSFRGIKRRFEIILNKPDVIFIDDYAHHPEELKRTIETVKKLFPGKKVTGIFQPHLYSRTRDFAGGFASSLELLDKCFILPVYPARELPMPGVDSGLIMKKMHHKNVRLITKDELTNHIKAERPEILLTLGAGDIDRLVEPLKYILRE